MQEKKYGLIIRAPKTQQKTQLTRQPIPKPAGFFDDDDDDDNVENEISRQASKNKSLKDVEEQHKKALEEDPSVFDYDGVYDDMKNQIVKPKVKEREQRESKYIALLKEKAKLREREHEVVYERKLAKERSKDDHLYADKDKFLTSAYKRKLAEKEQWEREERLRQLREERDDVTKKTDITDFYFNLAKNVAFGAADKLEVNKPERPEKEIGSTSKEMKKSDADADKPASDAGKPASATLHKDHQSTSRRSEDRRQDEASPAPPKSPESAHIPDTSDPPVEPPSNDQPKQDHHKKNEDALAAAKERFLARKKAKVVDSFSIF
ncbi:uncharacterized protein LOC141592813 [Silene latifolia]|uniref:uncharacterized protein LOC141592813 n=1 Tax=Silene latifolia TaxID=37657 RepID=UPI003D77AAD2